jgi:hypothetical protein
LAQLHAALDRVYKLAVSLPDAPLTRFQLKTAGLPRTTEAERLVVQRIGQDVFRGALIDYWGGRCPLTGITDPALLGEGIFVQFDEVAIREWLTRDATRRRHDELMTGYRHWRTRFSDHAPHYPGTAYVLLHSLSHTLIAEIAHRATHGAACHGYNRATMLSSARMGSMALTLKGHVRYWAGIAVYGDYKPYGAHKEGGRRQLQLPAAQR